MLKLGQSFRRIGYWHSLKVSAPPPVIFSCKGKDCRFIVEKFGRRTLAKWSKLTSRVKRHVDIRNSLIWCAEKDTSSFLSYSCPQMPKFILIMRKHQQAQTEGHFTKYWIRSSWSWKTRKKLGAVTNWRVWKDLLYFVFVVKSLIDE